MLFSIFNRNVSSSNIIWNEDQNGINDFAVILCVGYWSHVLDFIVWALLFYTFVVVDLYNAFL